VCALNFPVGMNAGLAKASGVKMKLDFERAVLYRIPQIETEKDRQFRQVLFPCDECQHFATVGESEPTGAEKFFSLSRQAKCIPIAAKQSISSLRSFLPSDSWRTLLQTFGLVAAPVSLPSLTWAMACHRLAAIKCPACKLSGVIPPTNPSGRRC
jgi:hypothetical protein